MGGSVLNIVGGRFKGTRLGFPTDRGFRPTQSKVRAALFNILGPEIEGARFLDLCCGTGAMGLEALSRGAASVVMVDINCRVAQENLDKLSVQVEEALPVRVVRSRLESFLKYPGDEPFSVIFFDPPWDLGGYDLLLKVCEEAGILAPHAIVICEHRRSVSLASVGQMHLLKTYAYGGTHLTFFRRNSA